MIEVYDILRKQKRNLRGDSLIYNFKTNHNHIISIPHGGTFFIHKYKDYFNLSKDILIDTDIYTDLIYDTGSGIRIISRLNPYFINMNRKRFIKTGKNDFEKNYSDFDSLHTLPLGGNKVLLKEYKKVEANEILEYYDQYHAMIQESIIEMKEKKGYALLFDCHSMNSIGITNSPDRGKKRPDICIGTLDDNSASKEVIDFFMKELTNHSMKYGLEVIKNKPYKGGYITQKYHNPVKDVHVIQIEIKKKIYMKEAIFDNPLDAFEIDERGFNIISWIVQESILSTSEYIHEYYKNI